MYYSAGTYEAFAHPEKPKDVDKKSAYVIGTGLAGLTAEHFDAIRYVRVRPIVERLDNVFASSGCKWSAIAGLIKPQVFATPL